MSMRTRKRIRREERYALGISLAFFACAVAAIALLKIGSYLNVPPQEITVRIIPGTPAPIVVGAPPPLVSSAGHGRPAHRAAARGTAVTGVPVPVPASQADSLRPFSPGGNVNGDSSAASDTTGSGFSAVDSLILRYPGFRSFALKEMLKRRYPKSKHDSLLAWAKANFAQQMERFGRIDPAVLNQMAIMQNSAYYGPYHIVTPSIGVGIPFSYTDLLKKIRDMFEGPPDE